MKQLKLMSCLVLSYLIMSGWIRPWWITLIRRFNSIHAQAELFGSIWKTSCCLVNLFLNGPGPTPPLCWIWVRTGYCFILCPLQVVLVEMSGITRRPDQAWSWKGQPAFWNLKWKMTKSIICGLVVNLGPILLMSQKGPKVGQGMLDFVEDLS